MVKVVLTDEGREKGFPILLHSGTIVYTGTIGTYIVPDESVMKLKNADVSFTTSPIISADFKSVDNSNKRNRQPSSRK